MYFLLFYFTIGRKAIIMHNPGEFNSNQVNSCLYKIMSPIGALFSKILPNTNRVMTRPVYAYYLDTPSWFSNKIMDAILLVHLHGHFRVC